MVGRNVRALREARGWSQPDLVEALSATEHPLGPNSLSKLERGIRPVMLAELTSFARVFGLAGPIALLSPRQVDAPSMAEIDRQLVAHPAAFKQLRTVVRRIKSATDWSTFGIFNYVNHAEVFEAIMDDSNRDS
jgi:transcriptional regulator with XRE-family HTH domain